MIMICIWAITLDDYTETAKITNNLSNFFIYSIYIGNSNRDKIGCNYNCPGKISEVFGRLITFASYE